MPSRKAVEPFEGNAQKVTYFGLPVITREMGVDARQTMVRLTPLSQHWY
ncbi:MAG: hypothetical protein ACOX6A_04745 [Atribacter sp.]